MSLLALAVQPPGLILGQSAAETDIWAFRMLGRPSTPDLGSVIRVTQRPAYDNQPHFPPGERLILYTAIDSTGQADIWSFDLVSGERKNVTRSAPESEYSATVMPTLERFSAVRVEADSTQRLWSFESGGTNPELILPSVQPVGYHAWIRPDLVALFVLGTPATLQITSPPGDSIQVAARNIGRSLQRIPDRETVSFVQWDSLGAGFIHEYDPANQETRRLAPLMEGNQDFTWTPDGRLLTGHGSRLFAWVPDESDEWVLVADLEPAGIRGISRIAVSSEGGWIAVVAEGAPGG